MPFTENNKLIKDALTDIIRSIRHLHIYDANYVHLATVELKINGDSLQGQGDIIACGIADKFRCLDKDFVDILEGAVGYHDCGLVVDSTTFITDRTIDICMNYKDLTIAITGKTGYYKMFTKDEKSALGDIYGAITDESTNKAVAKYAQQWDRITPGVPGQVLISNGSASSPAWVSPDDITNAAVTANQKLQQFHVDPDTNVITELLPGMPGYRHDILKAFADFKVVWETCRLTNGDFIEWNNIGSIRYLSMKLGHVYEREGWKAPKKGDREYMYLPFGMVAIEYTGTEWQLFDHTGQPITKTEPSNSIVDQVNPDLVTKTSKYRLVGEESETMFGDLSSAVDKCKSAAKSSGRSFKIYESEKLIFSASGSDWYWA